MHTTRSTLLQHSSVHVFGASLRLTFSLILSPAQAIPEGDWSCPDCVVPKEACLGKKKRNSTSATVVDAEAAVAVDDSVSSVNIDAKNASTEAKQTTLLAAAKTKPAAAKANDAPQSASVQAPSTHANALTRGAGSEVAAKAVVPCSNAKWSRPIREEGVGGAWMVGRRVQVWCDVLNSWREGRVDAIDYLDAKQHCVIFAGALRCKPELVTLSKVRW